MLSKSAAKDGKNPRAWFNLGLVDRAVGQIARRTSGFRESLPSLDPDDADIQYFLGDLRRRINNMRKPLWPIPMRQCLDPFHASAELGLAEVAQHTNDTDASLAHLNRFRHITSDNLGEPVSVSLWRARQIFARRAIARAPEPSGPHSSHICGCYRADAGSAIPADFGTWPKGPAAKPRRLPILRVCPFRLQVSWAAAPASSITTATGSRIFSL